MIKELDLYCYLSYRDYLRDAYQLLKANDSKYSFRYISQKVGSSSPSWLSDITKGRINLTENYLAKLVLLFKMGKKQERFFKLLVSYDQAPSHEVKRKYLDEILMSKELKVDLITVKKFKYFSEWYIPVIREFLFTAAFDGSDYSTLAKSLQPPIKEKEAREAMGILIDLELVSQDSFNSWRPTSKVVTKDSSIASVYISAYHLENIRIGSESIERFSKDERNISSVTMNFTEEQYLNACEEVKRLREKLLNMSTVSGNSGPIYQCNIQLFPVTVKGEQNES
jgi:uncharacterized protein (TIGR02147 family)